MARSSGQGLALEQLQALERAEALEVVGEPRGDDPLLVDVSIDCSALTRTASGLPLRDRERVTVVVPRDFPFDPAHAVVPHRRFAGFGHVQWGGSLCLYQSPDTEWDSADGMFGFLERLVTWLEQGALGAFEPTGAPLHPPAVYADVRKAGVVVVRADAPVTTSRWLGFAQMRPVREGRVDLVGWGDGTDIAAWPVADLRGVAVLLPSEMPFEFPTKMADLVAALEQRGVDRDTLLLGLSAVSATNPDGSPLYVVVGAPMRGTAGDPDRRQHLAVWCIEPTWADLLRITVEKYQDYEPLRVIGERAQALALEWAAIAELAWAGVLEARPEVTVARDHASPLARVKGRIVVVWGCGALGGPVADWLVRAGVRKLILYDARLVTPGTLARQPYDDADVGLPKASRLAHRLRRIREDVEVEEHVADVLTGPLAGGDWSDGADLVIDATASRRVLQKLELAWRRSERRQVPVVSMSIDGRAERGLLLVAGARHPGGPLDVAMRARAAATRPDLRHFQDAFWPAERPDPFQPEPGCSENTFLGSGADVAALAAGLLDGAATDLAALAEDAACARLVARPDVELLNGSARTARLPFSPCVTCDDAETGWQVRIEPAAWRDIMGWSTRSAVTQGSKVETGGVLFGEWNEVSRVVWVTLVSGPPPDSEADEDGFLCGTSGVREMTDAIARQWPGTRFVGLWHTHPDQAPLPSATDLRGVLDLLGATARHALMVIVGWPEASRAQLGTYVFTRGDVERLASVARNRAPRSATPRYSRRVLLQEVDTAVAAPSIGLALSGGGARAMAFHLGCLRALHDLRILDQVSVLSTVSGGSVIGALYAYSSGSFADFDAHVVEVLRSGLQREILWHWMASREFWLRSLPEAIARGGRAAVDLVRRRLGRDPVAAAFPMRTWSRTVAFERALRAGLFGDRRMTDVTRRADLDVVVNTTELRTGTAFRFGSRGSGGYRWGTVGHADLPVALAVAASAADPVVLPAYDLVLPMVDHAGRSAEQRLVLSDGGVYDNLGTRCMEPGRVLGPSAHVYRPRCIIACDAGVGVETDPAGPQLFASRVMEASNATFRRVQNDTRDRLHRYAATGALDGFVLAYLGQFDERLPWRPPDLVPRSSVVGYPTDFAPMSEGDLDRLAARGEQLVRILVPSYLPAGQAPRQDAAARDGGPDTSRQVPTRVSEPKRDGKR